MIKMYKHILSVDTRPVPMLVRVRDYYLYFTYSQLFTMILETH
jgi:hypothetical protein